MRKYVQGKSQQHLQDVPSNVHHVWAEEYPVRPSSKS